MSESSDDLPIGKEIPSFKSVFQSRRYSVFSKSFDPDNNNFEPEISSDIESVKNKIFENNQLQQDPQKFQALRNILSSIVLFRHLNDEDLQNILECMFERNCVKDEIIIKQGDPGNYLYIISSGVYDVYLEDKSSTKLGKKISEFDNKGFFGELALLYNQPRSASIVCREDGVLLCMNRDTFQRLVITISYNRRKKYIELLESIPFLKDSMSESERSKVADALRTVVYNPEQCIFLQNEIANGMYFIESGQIKIIQKDETEDKTLNILSDGDYFGELALLNKAPRSASAYSLSQCKLAFLPLDAFERLMGPCKELLKHNYNHQNI